jgi:hypothetical protein
MAVPNSRKTRVSEVAMMAPMAQHIRAMPGLPESFKIEAGVEKILGVED